MRILAAITRPDLALDIAARVVRLDSMSVSIGCAGCSALLGLIVAAIRHVVRYVLI